MKILLSDAGKRYNREWIFRHVTYEFNEGNAYAVTGNNGSGKSTLLQIISGAVQHSEGNITYQQAQHCRQNSITNTLQWQLLIWNCPKK